MTGNFLSRQRLGEVYATHRSFIQLLLLFVSFRALAVIAMRPGGFLFPSGPDQYYYHEIARLSAAGQYPFIHYWLEYPPLMPWMLIAAYKLSLLIPVAGSNFVWFNMILRWLMLPFDAGTLILIYLTARHLFDRQQALNAAQTYALIFIPFFVYLSWLDSVAVFFLLLAIYGLITRQEMLSGLGMGLGFGVKLFPLVVLPAAVRVFDRPKQWIKLGGWVLGSIALIFVPFLVISPAYMAAFFKTFSGRISWETVWALIDGYSGYGVVAPLHFRNDPALVNWIPPDTPASVIPWLWVTVFFAAAGLFLWTRRIDWKDPLKGAAFSGMTFAILLLYARGYSPQWAALVVALVVILLPGLRGTGYAILVSVVAVLEWPFAFVTFENLPGFIRGVIISRTLLYLVLAFEFATPVYSAVHWLQAVRRWLPVMSLAGFAGLILIGGPLTFKAYQADLYDSDPLRPLVEETQAPVIVVQADFVERLDRYLNPGQLILMPGTGGTAWVEVDPWLSDTLSGQDQGWILLDTTGETYRYQPLFDEIQHWFQANGCPVRQQWYEAVYAEHYALDHPVDSQTVEIAFEGGLTLIETSLPPATLSPGDGLCIHLTWLADQPPLSDYILFIHLLAADGQVAAQSDLYQPVSHWETDTPVNIKQGIALPAALPAGSYTLRIGLYSPADGSGLLLSTGETSYLPGMIEVK